MKSKDAHDLFAGIYDDFFGTKKEIEEVPVEFESEPLRIEVKEETPKEKAKKVKKINKNFEKALEKEINELEVDDNSKSTLRKMRKFAVKYQEQKTKAYIPFNFRLYCDNDQIIDKVVKILIDIFKDTGYLLNEKTIKESFFQIDDEAKIKSIYDNKAGIVVLKDAIALSKKELKVKEKILNALETNIRGHINGTITIIVGGDKVVINEALSENTLLRDKIFDFEISGTIPSVQDICEEVFARLREDYRVTNNFKIAFMDYVAATFPKSTLSYNDYIDSVYEKIIFNKEGNQILPEDIPEYDKDKTNEEIFAELNELVGLENVKKMLKDLLSLLEFKEKTGDKLKIANTNLHMIFLGNPGTGKTTVARMISGILYNLHYIETNKLIEVSAKDLVAEYVGQTAPKTMSVIEKALDGVLFIDEAYTLATKPGETNSFNDECVATLIQAMENYRDRLVVIFAGYTKEMQDFLNSNSGLVSRIGYTVEFKDYTTDELIQIFKGFVRKAGFKIENAAVEKAKIIIDKYKASKNFGNARFVRNLYEKSVLQHAANNRRVKDKERLYKITAQDICDDNLLLME